MRADRLVSLLLVLQAKPHVTAHELAERLEVTERTIYRDIDTLSAAGIPIYTQPGNNGGIFLDEDYRVSLTGFTTPELRTLFVAGGAGPLADLGLAKAAEGTLLKLFAALPTMHKHEVIRLQQRFYIDPINWFEEIGVPRSLALIQQAVWEDRQIQMSYQSFSGEVTDFVLEAHALVAKANVWYLVGRKPGAAIHTYRLSRIQHVALIDGYFERESGFDLAAYWQQASRAFEQDMITRFSPYVATIRVGSHISPYFFGEIKGRYEQLDPPDSDGWTMLRVQFLSRDEAQKYVVGFGTQIRVVEPPELQRLVLEVAHTIVALNIAQ